MNKVLGLLTQSGQIPAVMSQLHLAAKTDLEILSKLIINEEKLVNEKAVKLRCFLSRVFISFYCLQCP